MRTLVVDDSRLAAASLVKVLGKVDPQGSCMVAHSAAEALDACAEQHIDVVFLDIEMPGVNGLGVAQRLRRVAPQANVIFVTGYPEYALDAWDTQASAFIVKPAGEDEVRRALDSLRVPVRGAQDRGLFVKCFGNFEVFFDGSPVHFERGHTKELFAYLVDRRGALVSIGELVAVLWEDLPDTPSRRSQLRTLISDLKRTLERLGVPEVLVRRRGGVAVALSPERCDYLGYIEGLPDAACRYRGEYMCQYSWAEPTAAQLASTLSETWH